VRPARLRTGFSKFVVLPPRARTVLSTSRQVPVEIFAALGFLSEVSAVGVEFIKKRNPKDLNPKETFSLFRAFIRQAKTFWDAAEPLHHRAGPLNYYYCFLNLVKAYLCLVKPDGVAGKVLHGLSVGDPPKRFSEAAARVQDGVFPLFYQAYFGRAWPERMAINILQALGFCGDVTHEYVAGEFGQGQRLMCMCRIEIHEDEAFATVAISQYQRVQQYPEVKKKIEEVFDLVTLPSVIVEREFGLLSEEAKHFSFLETKKSFAITDDAIPRSEIVAHCYSALKDHYLYIPYDVDRVDFAFYLPYSAAPYAPFNEVMGTYVAMYYLSSLIRYSPIHMEEMLDSKEAWLVENFARSAPQTFLRHIANLILDEERRYKSIQ
jgi:hypothetical protein